MNGELNDADAEEHRILKAKNDRLMLRKAKQERDELAFHYSVAMVGKAYMGLCTRDIMIWAYKHADAYIKLRGELEKDPKLPEMRSADGAHD